MLGAAVPQLRGHNGTSLLIEVWGEGHRNILQMKCKIFTGGSTGIKDGPSSTKSGGGPPGAGAGEPEGDEEGPAEGEEETFYDAMKKEMGDRAARTRAALDAMDPDQRVAMEGHRPGAYLRLRFTGEHGGRPLNADLGHLCTVLDMTPSQQQQKTLLCYARVMLLVLLLHVAP